MTGCTSRPVSGADLQHRDRVMLAPSVWKMRLTLAFCSANPNWMPKPKHMFQICQNKRRFGGRCDAVSRQWARDAQCAMAIRRVVIYRTACRGHPFIHVNILQAGHDPATRAQAASRRFQACQQRREGSDGTAGGVARWSESTRSFSIPTAAAWATCRASSRGWTASRARAWMRSGFRPSSKSRRWPISFMTSRRLP